MKIILKLMVIAIALFIFPYSEKAEGDIESREMVINLLKDAANAQISLSEKPRTMSEIRDILSPYFTKEYRKLYLKGNLISTEGKYMTLGSDFAPFAIPFFAFTGETKVVIEVNEIYVIEYFSGSRIGPITYQSHYEGIKLKKVDGKWRVAAYLPDRIPERIITKANVTSLSHS